jgi:hypothetical protein
MAYVVPAFVANFSETAMKPRAELVRVEILVRAAPAGDNNAGRGNSRQPGETDEFPGHPHRCVA